MLHAARSESQDGNTALSVAAAKGHAHVVQRLLAAGADPCAKDKVCCTNNGYRWASGVARSACDAWIANDFCTANPNPQCRLPVTAFLLLTPTTYFYFRTVTPLYIGQQRIFTPRLLNYYSHTLVWMSTQLIMYVKLILVLAIIASERKAQSTL